MSLRQPFPAEGLADRQAAEAVRSRIDWKYGLGLTLTDSGFHHSVLGAFRERLDQGGAEQQLLDDMLKQFGDQGLLKARGPQRTDSTHVVAAIRELNRVECIGETMRHALNNLAVVVPAWLREQVSPDWFDLYGPRFDMEKQLPTGCERYRLWTSCVECGSSGSCGMESVWDCDKGEVYLHL